MIQLSVIIPVYKVEHTLDRCVESVLIQNVPSMEVILVDDGSPDTCPLLCDRWADRDNRIKVIHKPNGGLSDARNAGLDIATGEYVTFVDSDDYLLPDTYTPLMELLYSNKDADFVEYSIVNEDTTTFPLNISDKIYHSAKDYWLDTMAWNHGYAWNKIYRSELFDDLRFEKGRLFEDLLLLPHILKASKHILTTSHGTYQYTYNSQGLSKKLNSHTLFEVIKAELYAVWVMKTMPWSRNGHNLYYGIGCRLYDLLRIK